MRAAKLRVGGLAPLSTCDWPGELVATVFCQGCPWNCRYCHNPHLIPPGAETALDWDEVLAFLETRRGLLDGVVFSGGEPTLQAALPQAIRETRALGFRIGLHTGGPYPARLEAVLPLLDWIGYDVKAPFGEYERITGVPGSGDKARAGLEMVLKSGVECDIRTTEYEPVLDGPALARLADDLATMGVMSFRLQPYRAVGCVDA
ncbi:anaerobic ribonucleoside-triphosphate reductase activating protein [Breoghania sp.]|uniref:anaerobic ribonucleoside-triphosphate reductase activating protein n=1 Tax=Breoghania sp. TaxID=2065378 RepID=UPI002AA89DC8|nr:anaerobic ribonucleoside-triphosphate reductase activating protein [Breoghania sp.]